MFRGFTCFRAFSFIKSLINSERKVPQIKLCVQENLTLLFSHVLHAQELVYTWYWTSFPYNFFFSCIFHLHVHVSSAFDTTTIVVVTAPFNLPKPFLLHFPTWTYFIAYVHPLRGTWLNLICRSWTEMLHWQFYTQAQHSHWLWKSKKGVFGSSEVGSLVLKRQLYPEVYKYIDLAVCRSNKLLIYDYFFFNRKWT